MARLTGRARALVLATAVGLAVLLAGQAVASRVEADGARAVAVQQAAPLARVCEQDVEAARRAGADCAQAVAVARGEPGPRGLRGEPGRGVVGTTIVDDRLVIAYSDGTVHDVGPVVGGEGRGIRSTSLVDGRLVVEYTDGEIADLGPVVGPTGRSITAVDGSTGRLLVTLSDGTVLDAGPLPQGPAGEPGEPAPVVQSYTRIFGDGSAERCERTGGTDVDPVYDCTRTRPGGGHDAP